MTGDFVNRKRAVSSTVAVGLLILVAIGFAVAIQTFGSGLMNSVDNPPQVQIDKELKKAGIDLTVESVQNTDEMRITVAGGNMSENLSPIEGAVSSIQYRDIGASSGDEVVVVAADATGNERIVFSHTVSDEAVAGARTVVIEEVSHGGQFDSSLTITMGEISSTDGQSDQVGIAVDGGGTGVVSSGGTISLQKDSSTYNGPGGKHDIRVYDTPSLNNEILHCTYKNNGWHSETWSSCST